MARSHYYLSIADLAKARGSDPQFSFAGAGPDDFAAALQQALREADLFNRWRAAQHDPDAVDDSLAATDPQAEVTAKVSDLHTDVELLTALPMSVVRQRLNRQRMAAARYALGLSPSPRTHLRCADDVTARSRDAGDRGFFAARSRSLTSGPWKIRGRLVRVGN
jgi:hypothetical protein